MTSIKKVAQGCQSGTRLILEVDTLYYPFQPKKCIHTQLDGFVKILVLFTRLIVSKVKKEHDNSALLWQKEASDKSDISH